MIGLGWQVLAIVLVIIMIIFGAGKLPDVAKSVGQGVKVFKQEVVAPAVPTAASANQSTATIGSEMNGVVPPTPVSVNAMTETERADANLTEATTRQTI